MSYFFSVVLVYCMHVVYMNMIRSGMNILGAKERENQGSRHRGPVGLSCRVCLADTKAD